MFRVLYVRSYPFRLHVTGVLEIEQAGVVKRSRSVGRGVTARQGKARQGCYIHDLITCFRLKLECEKLASEKTEMQRHYVMVSTAVM